MYLDNSKDTYNTYIDVQVFLPKQIFRMKLTLDVSDNIIYTNIKNIVISIIFCDNYNTAAAIENAIIQPKCIKFQH